MSIFENFKTALKSLWNNKLRSFLTLLGIVVGVYAVVTLLAAAQGVQNQIGGFVEDFGPRTVFIMPGEDEGSGMPNVTASFAPSTIFVDDVKYLRDNAKLIDSEIYYAVFIGGLASKDGKKVTGLPVGINPGAMSLFSAKITKGRGIEQADLDNEKNVIVISERASGELGASIDDSINIGANSFKVIGFFKIDQQLNITSAGGGGDMFLIPVTVASKINHSDQINRIAVHAKSVDEVDEAIAEVKSLLRAKHGANDFTVLKPTDILKTITSITDVLKYMVAGIASISLLVGGIGIMNIMLVTVTERTREIGIRKAVGATESAILTQFLIESVLLTVIGALIGIGLAILTSLLAARFSPLEPAITGSTIMIAVGMGVVAGVIFGLLPAVRAARKNPVQALKYE